MLLMVKFFKGLGFFIVMKEIFIVLLENLDKLI